MRNGNGSFKKQVKGGNANSLGRSEDSERPSRIQPHQKRARVLVVPMMLQEQRAAFRNGRSLEVDLDFKNGLAACLSHSSYCMGWVELSPSCSLRLLRLRLRV